MTLRDFRPPVSVRGKFLRYVLTGGAAAVVDLGGFVLLVGLGVPLGLAAALSFVIAAIVNFRLTAAFVFGARGDLGRFALFLTFALAGLALNTGVTVLGVLQGGLPPAAAKLGGIGVAFLFNFSVNALFDFRSQK
jgi:putative flippase GtrA